MARTLRGGRQLGETTSFPRTPDEVATEAGEGHGALDKEKYPTLVGLLSRRGGSRSGRLRYVERYLRTRTPEQLVKLEQAAKERPKPRQRRADPRTGSLGPGVPYRPQSMAKRRRGL